MRSPFRIMLAALALLLAQGTAPAQAPALQSYIQEGLKSNLALQQKDIDSRQALSALREAKGLFLPKVALNAGYTSGYGGRSIAFPIGDLLNPVYSTLNQMTQSQSFPQVENVEQNFFPENFYDVKLHTTVPIWNAPIREGRDIRLQQVRLQEIDGDRYRRELVRDIQVAYYQHLQALLGSAAYQDAIASAQEAERVSQRLLANGAGLPAHVARAQAEREQLQASLAETQQQAQAAARYLNFLLNRPLDSPVDTAGAASLPMPEAPTAPLAVEGREELKMLGQARAIGEQALQLQKAQLQPTLGGFLDLGMQAENFKVNEDAAYILFGVQLDVPIFGGFGQSERIARAEYDIQRTQLQQDQVKAQLELQATLAADQLSLALRQHQAAQARLSAANSYHQLTERAFREGKASFIEAVDARNQRLMAAQQLAIAATQARIAHVQLEYATAQTPLH